GVIVGGQWARVELAGKLPELLRRRFSYPILTRIMPVCGCFAPWIAQVIDFAISRIPGLRKPSTKPCPLGFVAKAEQQRSGDLPQDCVNVLVDAEMLRALVARLAVTVAQQRERIGNSSAHRAIVAFPAAQFLRLAWAGSQRVRHDAE